MTVGELKEILKDKDDDALVRVVYCKAGENPLMSWPDYCFEDIKSFDYSYSEKVLTLS